MTPARAALFAAAIASVGLAPPGLHATRPHAVTRAALLSAEARGAAGTGDLQLLLDGVNAPTASLRGQALRALGRLERPELVELLGRWLTAEAAAVRAEAANALAQSAANDPAAAARAREALLGRLRVERDAAVIAALAESVGRLPVEDPPARQAVEDALLKASFGAGATAPGAGRAAAGEALEGALRGLESLTRAGAKAGPLSTAARQRLAEVASSREGAAARPRLRRLALLALNASGGPDRRTLAAALSDPDRQVRRLAAAAPTAGEDDLALLLRDASAMVRYEALRALGRRFEGPPACEAAIDGSRDRDGHVALLALDVLATCPGPAAAELLEREASNASPDGWRRGAHALVSLAAVAPERARPLARRASDGTPWQTRMYAARAAAVLGDEEALRRLAADAHPNVREAAVAALGRSAGHAADAVYLAALASGDNQLVMAAASALRGSPDAERAVPALLAALARLTMAHSDTSRDPRMAVLDTLKTLGSARWADGLRTYASDFDPKVAAFAAGVLTAWTGQRVEPGPGAPPDAVQVGEAQLDRLEGAVLRFSIEGLGVFEARLLPKEAPLTCLRIARLAAAGSYDGQTFHRVVPNFVIQGGSPGANEFAGRDPYMRDEVGRVSQRRGTLGVSTRGRHTGDAQIYVNLVDSPRLDHEYTVFAEVVRGMEIVDAVHEGAVMTRVELLARGGTAR